MKKPYRYIYSLLLIMIYLLIVFSPLAPFAMQSKLIAHAVTGECSGDCRIDGCSLERSAAHTCCCWHNKSHSPGEIRHRPDSCCDTATSGAIAGVPRRGAVCCTPHIHDAHECSDESESVSTPASQDRPTYTVSSAPCGSGKLFALLNVETTHHLPFFFIGEIHSPRQSDLFFNPPNCLTSRPGDAPDPPPIIMIFS